MKKKNLLSVLPLLGAGVFAFNAANAQSAGYTINGDIKGFGDPYIYLYHPVADSFRIDSAAVASGKFTFKGQVDAPVSAIMFTKDKQKRFQIYIENSNINITGDADSLSKVTITGSASQDDYVALSKSGEAIEKQEEAAYQTYQSAKAGNDSLGAVAAEKKLDSLDKANTEVVKNFIKTHPNSAVSLSQLPSMAYSTPYKELNEMFTSLSPALQNSSAGQKFAKHLAIMDKVQDGKPAIDFAQNDVNGKPVNLAGFKGKYVLVDFWASWCGPCRAENPNVVKAYNKYKDKNFTILGVSLDESADNWKQAITHDNLTWAEISDLKGWKNEAAAAYGVQAIPANFLIDPNGIIIGHNLRGEDLENKLAEVLK